MRKPMYRSLFSLVIFIVFISCKTKTIEELTINQLFADHMVLQQEAQITITGSSTPMEEVKFVSPWGETQSTMADKDGNWSFNITTPKAGGPYELKIQADTQMLVLNDVLIGEVWLASGQSNMEMPLTGYLPNEPVINYKEEIANADYSNIRFLNVERATSTKPLNKFKGEWTVTSPATAEEFSATAYFFARKLHKELNVPIGIINSSWGGTPVESWMSHDKIIEIKEFEEKMANFKSIDTANISQFISNYQTQIVPSDPDVFQHLVFKDKNFSAEGFDHSGWAKTMLPGNIDAKLAPLGEEGVFWYRKTINVPNTNSAYTLHIKEGIDDSDVTFINGQKVGNSQCWNCERVYEIPTSLLKLGENTIAIRMVNLYGKAGVSGEMYLKNKDTEINIDGEWFFLPIATIVNIKGTPKFITYHAKESEFAEKLPQIEALKKLNDPHFPGVLYNGMINPLTSYHIKGAIWYQGESNVGRAAQYKILFPEMITDWRAKWDNDFSFYFVQIAPYNYGNGLSPGLRDAQRKTLETSKTGMAITMDIGHKTSIHPGNKQDVGSRLARLALVNDYGKDMVPHGPIYQDHQVEGNSITLNFSGVGSGLMTKNNTLNGFEISGADKKFIKATAKILNDKVVVKSWSLRNPMHVRYAWKDYIEGSLFNKEGLPASSFSTE